MKPVAGTSKIGFVGAVMVHGLMLAVLFFVEPAEPVQYRRRPPVKVKLVKRPKPVETVATRKESIPPAPKPKIVEAKSPKKRKAPKQAPAKKKKPKEVITAQVQAQPKPNPLPPKPIKPRKFTVSMEATVSTGSVAVPTSEMGFAFGTPDGDPDAEPRLLSRDQLQNGALGKRRTGAARVLPKLVSSPSYSQMRALYPKQALQEGREANVGLRVLISTTGKVVRVKIIRTAGNGFDQVAASLVRRFRFQPATQDGQPVAMWIPWTYKFRLDG